MNRDQGKSGNGQKKPEKPGKPLESAYVDYRHPDQGEHGWESGEENPLEYLPDDEKAKPRPDGDAHDKDIN